MTLSSELKYTNSNTQPSETPVAPTAEDVFSCPELASIILTEQGDLTSQQLEAFRKSSPFFCKVAIHEGRKRAVNQLLSHVVHGEQNEAEAMIIKSPELLKISAAVSDFSERTIVGTAFQAAIGAGDKPMWQMILSYLTKEEAREQFNEQFPNGVEDEHSALELSTYYNQLALAILHDQDKGESRIEAFRTSINQRKIIKEGKHFNLQHLVAAYCVYIDHLDSLPVYRFSDFYKSDLFWRKVIGYAQRHMTAYDAQMYCNGLENLKNTLRRFKRSFKFNCEGTFFPLEVDSGLGFDFACFSYSNEAAALNSTEQESGGFSWYERFKCQARIHSTDRDQTHGLVALQQYVAQKQSDLEELKESLELGLYQQTPAG